MPGLYSLERRIRKIRENVPKKVNEFTKQVAMEVLVSLVSETPVDTSRALSNWQVGIPRRITRPIPPFVKGRYGSTRGASVSMAINVGKAMIGTRKVGETINITNNLDYIELLEAGYSPQNAGFVARAEAEAQRKIANATIDYEA